MNFITFSKVKMSMSSMRVCTVSICSIEHLNVKHQIRPVQKFWHPLRFLSCAFPCSSSTKNIETVQ